MARVSGDAGLHAIIAQHLAQRPFVWGVSDCSLSVCDVLVGLGLPDAAAAWRDRYDSGEGAAEIMAAGGGLARIAAGAFVGLGWPEVPPSSARPGDVGIVCAWAPALAIFDGERWCVKSVRGMMRFRTAARCWSTGHA